MKQSLSIILLLLLAYPLNRLKGQDYSPLNILPESGSVKGWRQKRVPEFFSGENLFTAIDGAADVFLEYGFISMARASYIKKRTSIDLEIYLMKDSEASYGIMTLKNDGFPIRISDGCAVISKDYYGMLMKGRFFAVITDPSGAGGHANEINNFFMEISGTINDKSIIPVLISDLNVQGIKKEVLFYGDIVLNNLFYFGVQKPFDYRKGVYYETAEGPSIVFLCKNEISPERIVSTTLENFEKSGKYKVDYNSKILINSRMDTLFIHADYDKIIMSVRRTGIGVH